MSIADEIERLSGLQKSGAISDEEYRAAVAKVTGGRSGIHPKDMDGQATRELARLDELRSSGALGEDEYARMRRVTIHRSRYRDNVVLAKKVVIATVVVLTVASLMLAR